MYIWKKLLNFTMFHIAPGNNITLMITQIDFTHLSLHLLYVFFVLVLNRTIFCLVKITIQSWIDKKNYDDYLFSFFVPNLQPDFPLVAFPCGDFKACVHMMICSRYQVSSLSVPTAKMEFPIR